MHAQIPAFQAHINRVYNSQRVQIIPLRYNVSDNINTLAMKLNVFLLLATFSASVSSRPQGTASATDYSTPTSLPTTTGAVTLKSPLSNGTVYGETDDIFSTQSAGSVHCHKSGATMDVAVIRPRVYEFCTRNNGFMVRHSAGGFKWTYKHSLLNYALPGELESTY